MSGKANGEFGEERLIGHVGADDDVTEGAEFEHLFEIDGSTRLKD